jgi:tetratricopeptide (TPR) repeat protein
MSGRPVPLVTLPLAELLAIAQEYETAKRYADALRLLDHVLAADPNHADALHLAGIARHRLGDPVRALALMERSLRHGINTPLYFRNICEIYRALGRLDEAVAMAERAQRLAPGEPASLYNLGVVYYHALRLREALACADQALAIDPGFGDAHFLRAEVLLLRGEWEEGWREYEWRFRLSNSTPLLPPTSKPQWDGAAMPDSTLLVVVDQGFGDGIQFMRYLPWAMARCPRLIVAAGAELAPMLRQIVPPEMVRHNWQGVADFDAYCALSSLPRLEGTRAGRIPAAIPYLAASPERVARWAERLRRLSPAGHRRIGIIWAGRPTHANDRLRSIPLATLAPLGMLSNVTLFAIQKGPTISQTGAWYGRAPLVNLGAEVADYDDTMAILENLDLLITVDTSVAHLAGALGRPVWVMLPLAPDWRWLLDREDTGWYPSMRLFRQRKAGDWAGVVRDVAAALG